MAGGCPRTGEGPTMLTRGC